MEYKTSGLSIAGFIIGIFVCVAIWLSICCGGYTGEMILFIIGAVGIVLSFIGKSEMKKKYNKASGLAYAAVILSIVGTVFAFFFGLTLLLLAPFTAGLTFFI